jgi:hypothetical protein
MRKSRNASSPKLPTHFFVKQLAGEDPPSLATMERLYDVAADFVIRGPWKLLNESELVLVKPPPYLAMCAIVL